MRAVETSENMECSIFVTGMHLLARYGYTYRQVEREGFSNVFTAMNQNRRRGHGPVLANTAGPWKIRGRGRAGYDCGAWRPAGLAGAIVGAFRTSWWPMWSAASAAAPLMK